MTLTARQIALSEGLTDPTAIQRRMQQLRRWAQAGRLPFVRLGKDYFYDAVLVAAALTPTHDAHRPRRRPRKPEPGMRPLYAVPEWKR